MLGIFVGTCLDTSVHGYILGTCLIYFGCMGTFWVHFGYILGTQVQFGYMFGTFCEHVGYTLGTFLGTFVGTSWIYGYILGICLVYLWFMLGTWVHTGRHVGYILGTLIPLLSSTSEAVFPITSRPFNHRICIALLNSRKTGVDLDRGEVTGC
jgi:hypothetical protein